jgi:sugar phosphate isomerase/epimerase
MESKQGLLTRRVFLTTTAAGALAIRASAADLAPAKLGVQLYTVRNLMPAKDDEVLHQIAAIGYKEVEGDHPTLMRVAPILKSVGLAAVSCHIPTPSVVGPGDDKQDFLEKVLTDLKSIGVEYAVVPYIDPKLRTREVFDGFAAKMNTAGAMAQKFGMQFAYHNHAFEWGQMDGKRVFDRMFANTDPKLVQFEVDVFWLTVGGVDPVAFLKEHAGRVPLLHLKDKLADQKVQYNENVPKATFKEVGNGNVDFPGILRTARSIGVKHYFVEQDWTPADPIASLKQSFSYVRGLRG